MKIEDAIQFFSEFYGGKHRFPNEIKNFGLGWCIHDDRTNFDTYDGHQLTRLVLMAHDKCVRVGLSPIRNGIMRIEIWQRQREGDIMERHPTIEKAILLFRAE